MMKKNIEISKEMLTDIIISEKEFKQGKVKTFDNAEEAIKDLKK